MMMLIDSRIFCSEEEDLSLEQDLQYSLERMALELEPCLHTIEYTIIASRRYHRTLDLAFLIESGTQDVCA